MLPFLTFATGLVAGVVGVRLLKNAKAPTNLRQTAACGVEKARHGLDLAQDGLRNATVSGLTAIEKSSAHLREKLTAAPTEAVQPQAETVPTETITEAEPPPRPRKSVRGKSPQTDDAQAAPETDTPS